MFTPSPDSLHCVVRVSKTPFQHHRVARHTQRKMADYALAGLGCKPNKHFRKAKMAGAATLALLALGIPWKWRKRGALAFLGEANYNEREHKINQ